MKKILPFLFISIVANSIAQPVKFQLTVGNTQTEIANSICQTSDGGYIIAGVTYPTFTDADVYLVKLSSTGNMQWTKTYGRNSNDLGHYVIETAGGYLIAGETESFSASRDAFLIRTDLNGDTLWTKTYGGSGSDIANKIEELPSGNFLLTGSFQVNGINRMGLLRIDSTGILLGEGYVAPYQFASPINKATYLGNDKVGFTGANPVLVIADTNGTYITTYADFYSGRSVDAILTSDQKYVSLVYDDVGGPQGSNITLTKLDPQNTSAIFSKKFSTNFDDTPVSVVEASDHGFVILATSYVSFSSNQSLLLIKTDSLGDLTWTKRYTVTAAEDNFEGQVIKTSDGGYAIAASTTVNGNFSNYDYYIIKTDSLGDSFCNQAVATLTASTATASTGTLPTQLTYTLANSGTLVSPVILTHGLLNTLCNSVGIGELEEENNSFTVFPNPAHNELSVSSKQFGVGDVVKIINVLGQEIYLKKIKRQTSTLIVQTTNFPQGIYFLSVNTNKNIITKKIVINHSK
ncbi:MAG: T9SS type A sorting domain-containing protein [Bacteroidia bacterium]